MLSAAVLGLGILSTQAHADNLYWDGVTGNWSDAANWSTANNATTPNPGAAPTLADAAFFNITTVNGAEIVYLAGNQGVNGLIFTNTGSTTLLGGVAATPAVNTLFLAGTLSTSTGAVVIGSTSGAAVNVALLADQTWTIGAGGMTVHNTLSNATTGTYSLTKAGTGLLTLNGANTYGGSTTISAGAILANSNTALGTGPVTINAVSGAQLQLGSGTNVANAVTINGGGVAVQGVLYVPTGNATFSGSLIVNGSANSGGHLATASAANRLTIAGDNTVTSNSFPLTIRNGYVLFSGAQNYTSGTTLANAGATVHFAKIASMPSSGTVTLASGTTLAVNVGGAGEFTVGGTAAGSIGGLLIGVGGQNAPVSLAAGSALALDTTNALGVVTISDPWTSVNGTTSTNIGLVKLGTGTLALTGGGTYTGAGGHAGFPFVVRQGRVILDGGTHAVSSELVIGGTYTTATGAAGYDAQLQVNSGTLTVGSWLSIGRGNGIGGVSSDLIVNNSAVVTAANFSAGFNAATGNFPKGSITLNNNASLTITGNGVFNLAESTGTNFAFTLNDSSVLTATGTGAKYIGNAGNGTMTINGNSVVNFAGTGNVFVGFTGNSATGVLNLNGGSLSTASDLVVGWSGTGTVGKVNLNSGVINVGTTVTKWMILGANGSARAEINVAGGTLNLNTNTSLKFTTGTSSGASVFNLNGGVVNFYSDNATTLGGTGNLDLMQAGSAASNNTFNLNGGTITVPAVIATTNNGTKTFNFNGGVLRAAANSANFLNLGTSNSFANVRNLGAVIDTNGFSVTAATPLVHSNVVGDNAIDGGLTKRGAGTLTLNGANTYTGPTTITGGNLVVGAAGNVNSSASITVNGPGAVFSTTSSVPVSKTVTVANGGVDGTGTINAVNVAASPTNFVANGNNGTGTLTIGALTFAGAGAFNVRSNGNEGLVIGSLTTSGAPGAITVNAASTTGAWTNGTVNLVNFGSMTGWNFSDFALGTVTGLTARQSRSLILNGNYLALTIAGDTPKWTGLDNGNWVVGPTGSFGNWKLVNGGNAVDYLDGDQVLFDDSAAGTTNITINAPVTPFSTTISSESKAYTFSGAGGIAGTGSLVKTGAGTVTLATLNTYTGGTTLTGGRVNLNSTSPVGTGALVLNGVTLDNTSGAALVNTANNAQTWNGDITFLGSNDLDLGTGAVTVPGTGVDRTVTVAASRLIVGEIKAAGINFTKQGAGALVLTSTGAGAAGSVFGSLNVAAGTLQMNRDGADVAGSGDVVTGSLSGAGTIANGAAVARWFFVNGSSSSTFAGSLINGGAGPLGFAKQGTGTVTLTGTNSYTDPTTVDNGTLVINGANTGPGTNATVNAGKLVLGNTSALGAASVIRLNGTANSSTLVYATDGGDNLYELSFGTTTVATIVSDRATPGAGVNHTMTTTPAAGMGGGTITVASGANVTSGAGRITFNQFGLGAGTVQTTMLAPTTANVTLGDVFKVNNNVTQTLGLGGTSQDNLVTGIISNGTALSGTNVINLLKADASTWTLTQNNTYTGTTTVSGGTLRVGNGGNTGSLGSGAVTNNALLVYNRNDNFAVANAFSGAGTLTQGGTGTLTLTGTNTSTGAVEINAGSAIQVGDGNNSGALGSGPVLNNGNLIFNRFDAVTAPNAISGTGAVHLVSSGTLTLSGASTYTGPTTVSAGGTLSVTGSIASSPVSVTYGALDGTGSVGATTVGSSSLNSVSNGNGTSTTALTLSSLTFQGEATANVRAGGGTAAGIVVTGSLVTTPVNGQVTINAYSPAWVSGLNNLISFGSFAGSLADFTLGTVTGANGRVSPSGLVLNGNNIALNMTVDAPKWTGLDNTQWTIGSTGPNGNWRLIGSGLKTDYQEGDTVLFDDTATNTTVDLATYVNPSAMTFNNATKNYILQSSAGYEVTGTASLTKSGAGTLTITNTNSFSGGTTLNAGRLNINSPAAIGTGPLTINGGTIGNTSGVPITYANVITQAWNGDFTFAGPSSLDLGTGAVTVGGAGADRVVTISAATLSVGELKAPAHGFIKQGAGTLVLASTGANTAGSVIGGNLHVAAGTIQINRSDVDAANSGDLVAASLSGAGTITNGAAVPRWLFVTGTTGTATTFSGLLANGGTGGLGLFKGGAGSLTLTNANAYSDVTTVDGGVLNFAGAGSIGASSSYIISNTGILQVDSSSRLGGAPIAINSGGAAVGTANRLEISGNTTLANTITLAQRNNAADSTTAADAIRSTSGNNTLTGPITITTGGNQARIQVDAGSLTLAGPITTSAGAARNLYLQGAGDGLVSGLISDNAGNAAGTIAVHKYGTGSWTLSAANTYTGGTNVMGGVLAITGSNIGSGPVLISDATLRATGTATANGQVTLGGTSATVDVAAGQTLTFGSAVTGNSLTKAGTGTLVVNGPVSVTGATTVTGRLALGAASHTFATITGPGTVASAAGASVTSDNVTLGGLEVGGTHVIRNSTTPSASVVSSLTIAGTPGAWTGKLDLTNNALVINAADAAGQIAIVDLVRDQVASGRAGGTWNGNGITSSTMTEATFAAVHNLAIADAGDLNLTTFRGQTGLTADSTIVTIAHNGDATLDGKVDAFDLNRLAANWQQANRLWSSGDFTGDGKVDAFDLNLLAANWQFGSAATLEAALASFPVFGAADISGAIAAVPEPASLAVLALGGAALLGRRRRK